MTDPHPEGLGVSTCIELALKDSGIERDEVGAVRSACLSRNPCVCSGRNVHGHPETCVSKAWSASSGRDLRVQAAIMCCALSKCLHPPPGWQVNYINAHATSTLVGDKAEVKAIKKVFSDLSHVKMNATKSMIGHCLGAGGHAVVCGGCVAP